jgi:2-oxoglutarate dehydrogenase E2 component (dihydrolipoamide succinyltransferase)
VVVEHGLDPNAISGSGPDGRITKKDAMDAIKTQKGATAKSPAPAGAGGTPEPPAKAPSPSPQKPAAAPGMSTGARQRRVPMSNLRKRIAENLVASKQNSAHVTTFNEVDMSAIMEIRSKHKDAFQERYGVRLGFMSFFVKASQYALDLSPEVNAYLDGTDLVYNDFVNIGVALSSDKGLLTPVIKDVAGCGFGDVETKIIDFIARANEKRLKPDEMVGATFTISNGGVFGSLLSTPIPSPPQTAVLGMHTIEKRPVVVNDEIVIRPMMYVALTYDHRVIDGREAVGFLGKIKQLVEDPTELLLGL